MSCFHGKYNSFWLSVIPDKAFDKPVLTQVRAQRQKTNGKIQRASGKISFVEIFAAISSALWYRAVRKAVRENPQSLGHAGAEPVGLDEQGHEAVHIIDIRPVRQVSQRGLPRLSSPQLQIQQIQFLAQLRVAQSQFLSDPADGRVQAHAGFHAHDQQIERVREPLDEFFFLFPKFSSGANIRQEQAQHGKKHRAKSMWLDFMALKKNNHDQ